MVRPEQKLVLITGNSRSGTTHMHRMLRKVGLDVGHEYVQKDGTVSCFFFVDHSWYPDKPSERPKAHQGQRYGDFYFENSYHVVRHPLKCIGSNCSTMGVQHSTWLDDLGLVPYEGQYVRTGRTKLWRMMRMWHEVNLACEKETDWRFRIENVDQVWKRMARELGLGKIDMPVFPPSNRSSGNRKAKVITVGDMNTEDVRLTKSIIRMARRYGYDL